MIKRKSKPIEKIILDRALSDRCPITGKLLEHEPVGFVDYYVGNETYPIIVPTKFIY